MLRHVFLLVLICAIAAPRSAATESAATEIMLGKVEILTLRNLNDDWASTTLFTSLSPVGQKSLFGDRALDVEAFFIDDTGLWKWRTHNDILLVGGLQGEPYDAIIIMNVLSGNMPDSGDPSRASPDPLLAADVSFYAGHAEIHISTGGPMESRGPAYYMFVSSAQELLNNNALTIDKRNKILQLLGMELMNLPSTARDELSQLLPDDSIIYTSIEAYKATVELEVESFPNAPTLDEESTQDALDDLFDDCCPSRQFKVEEFLEHDLPLKKHIIDPDIENVYIVPDERGTTFYFRINKNEKEQALLNYDSGISYRKLHTMSKTGSMDIFMSKNGTTHRINPNFLETPRGRQ